MQTTHAWNWARKTEYKSAKGVWYQKKEKRETEYLQILQDGHSHLMNDYFSENSIYTESQFDRGSEWENNCSFEL